MRMVITGGAGFVGSSLAIQLKTKYPSYEITAFDNLKRRGSEFNLADLRNANVRYVHGDIRCKEDLDSLKRFDVLVEASAEPSVLAGLDGDPSYVINNNLIGSFNCFGAALKNKANIVFLSTSRVYPINRIERANFLEEETRYSFADKQAERGISRDGVSEELELSGARSFYGATKLSSEIFLREFEEFSGLNVAIARFGVVSGPRQMGKTDQGIATLWLARHYWKEPICYIGYGGLGKQVRDILHIDDLVDLIDLQIHQPQKFAGKVYNVGGGLSNSCSLLEMTALCERITGNRTSIAADPQTRPADLRCYISDTNKIQQDLGWKPTRSLDKVFEDIFEWISENEIRLEPILR